MMDLSAMQPARPLQISELVSRAEQFVFKDNIPLKYWIRTADMLRQQVCLY